MATGRKITVEFVGKDTSLGDTATAVEKRFGKLGGKLERAGSVAGKLLAGGIIAGGAAMLKFGDQASDLSETMNKTNVVFGKSADGVVDWASKADKSLGLSKNAALSMAAQFGDMFKQLGQGEAQAAQTSQGIVKLATDLGSFHNLETGDVLDKIAGAMRGEYDAIQKIIPGLSDARVKQEALRQSGKSSVDQLTEQDKAMAALSIITKDGAAAHNDFAETSDGLANKQKILRAQLENVSTELGAKAIPFMLKAVEIGQKMIAWADNNRTTLTVLVTVLGGFTAAVWAIGAAMKAWIAIQAALNIVLAANPIGLVVVAVAALVAGLVIAYKKSETFRKVVNGAFGAVKKVAVGLFGWVKRNWPLLLGILTGPFGLAVVGIARHWDKIVGGIKAIPGRIRALGGVFKDAGKWVIGQMVEGLKNAAGVISGIAGNVWNAVKGMLNAGIDRINSALEFTIRIPASPDVHVNPPNIPHLARGGIVRARPGGVLARIGEGGHDEAVVPLSGPHARGLGTTVVNKFYIQTLDPKAAGKAVVDALVGWQRGTGQVVPVRTR